MVFREESIEDKNMAQREDRTERMEIECPFRCNSIIDDGEEKEAERDANAARKSGQREIDSLSCIHEHEDCCCIL